MPHARGTSTGPRTVEGLQQLRQPRYHWASHCRGMRELRAELAELRRGAKALMERT